MRKEEITMQVSIQVGTMSQAIKAKQVLERHGVRAYLRRTSQTSGQGGCGYRVSVVAYTPDIAMWLREEGVTILGIKGRESP